MSLNKSERRVNVRKLLVGALLAGGLGLAAPAMAQEGYAVEGGGEAAAPPAEPNTGRISLDFGIDFTTNYFFRGVLQEDQGFITQPWIEFGINLYEGEGAVSSVDWYAGNWNSFHDEQTGQPAGSPGPASWYEADLYTGVGVTLYEDFSLGLDYIAYTSPNDAFSTIQELDLHFGYDDSGLWEEMGVENFALSPSATLAFELDNSVIAGDEGVFLSLGVGPSFEIISSEKTPVTLSVPLTLGLGVDDYFVEGDGSSNDTFGFFDAGLDLSMPLTFVDPEFGSWEVGAGVHFLFLGDNNETINNGDDFEAIGTLSLSMSY